VPGDRRPGIVVQKFTAQVKRRPQADPACGPACLVARYMRRAEVERASGREGIDRSLSVKRTASGPCPIQRAEPVKTGDSDLPGAKPFRPDARPENTRDPGLAEETASSRPAGNDAAIRRFPRLSKTIGAGRLGLTLFLPS
jgi:hypothetical protein